MFKKLKNKKISPARKPLVCTYVTSGCEFCKRTTFGLLKFIDIKAVSEKNDDVIKNI